MGGSATTAGQGEPSESLLEGVLTRLEASVEVLAADAAEAVFAAVPAYEAGRTSPVRTDVTAHIRTHYGALFTSFREQRFIAREDLMFVRAHAARRVKQVKVADFIAAFQIAQRVLWDEALALAAAEDVRAALTDIVPYIVRYFEVATTHAAEVFAEAEQLLATTVERLRRDVLFELLSDRLPDPGPRRDVLRDAGLTPDGALIVIAAVPSDPADDTTLRGAASALARALRRPLAPLTVLRMEEIVIVSPAPKDAGAVVDRIARARSRLADHGTQLTVGISTVHSGLSAVGRAYREAAGSRERLLPHPGLVALPTMSAFDYLTLHSDQTGPRLLSDQVSRFVTDDLANGGTLVDTLVAYVKAGLNVADTATRLNIHNNTAYHRLVRIAERTGVDMRDLPGVIELLIAARLGRLRLEGPRTPDDAPGLQQ